MAKKKRSDISALLIMLIGLGCILVIAGSIPKYSRPVLPANSPSSSLIVPLTGMLENETDGFILYYPENAKITSVESGVEINVAALNAVFFAGREGDSVFVHVLSSSSDSMHNKRLKDIAIQMQQKSEVFNPVITNTKENSVRFQK